LGTQVVRCCGIPSAVTGIEDRRLSWPTTTYPSSAAGRITSGTSATELPQTKRPTTPAQQIDTILPPPRAYKKRPRNPGQRRHRPTSRSVQRTHCTAQRDTAHHPSARNRQNLPVFKANPPSSAISNRNPPWKIGTYNTLDARADPERGPSSAGSPAMIGR